MIEGTTTEKIVLPDGEWTIEIAVAQNSACLLWSVRAPDGTGRHGMARPDVSRKEVREMVERLIYSRAVS